MNSKFFYGFIPCLFVFGALTDVQAQFSYQPYPTRFEILPVESYFHSSTNKHIWPDLSEIESNCSKNLQPAYSKLQSHALNSLFLPKWCAADLPFFCKIEHNVGLQLPVMVKFRLGSVEYVDWMEGK